MCDADKATVSTKARAAALPQLPTRSNVSEGRSTAIKDQMSLTGVLQQELEKRQDDLCVKLFSCTTDWRPPAVAFSIRAPHPVVFACLIRGVERRGKTARHPTFAIFHFSPTRLIGADAQMRQFWKRDRRKERRIKSPPIVFCVRRKIKAAGYFQGVSNGSQHPGCISPRRPAVPLETLLVWWFHYNVMTNHSAIWPPSQCEKPNNEERLIIGDESPLPSSSRQWRRGGSHEAGVGSRAGGGGWWSVASPSKQEVATLLHSGKRCIYFSHVVEVSSRWMDGAQKQWSKTLKLIHLFWQVSLFSFAEMQSWRSHAMCPCCCWESPGRKLTQLTPPSD